MTAIIILSALSVVLFGIVIWQCKKIKWLNQTLALLRISHCNEIKWRIVATISSPEMCEYKVSEAPYGAYVYKYCFDYPIQRITVKFFQNDDIEYARNCAQELCDKLNEEI